MTLRILEWICIILGGLALAAFVLVVAGGQGAIAGVPAVCFAGFGLGAAMFRGIRKGVTPAAAQDRQHHDPLIGRLPPAARRLTGAGRQE